MTHPHVVPIDDETFDSLVLASDRTFLVDFTASWCGPCKVIAPIIEKLAGETAGVLRVGVLDVDESPKIAARYGVRGLPTVVVFAHGREIGRQVGVTSEKRLRELART